MKATKEQKFDISLLNSLVCPKTKKPLTYDKKRNVLISKRAKLAYPIKNGIPIMLTKKAKKL